MQQRVSDRNTVIVLAAASAVTLYWWLRGYLEKRHKDAGFWRDSFGNEWSLTDPPWLTRPDPPHVPPTRAPTPPTWPEWPELHPTAGKLYAKWKGRQWWLPPSRARRPQDAGPPAHDKDRFHKVWWKWQLEQRNKPG